MSELRRLLEENHYPEAEIAARNLLQEVEADHGPRSPAAAKVLDLLVESLWRGGKAAGQESRALAEKALGIKERLLSKADPDLAVTLSNLGNLFNRRGEYDRARHFHERALVIRERSLGPQHPDVARSLNNLAKIKAVTGDFTGAKSLYERALSIWEKARGPQHPDVADGLGNLASLFMMKGDHQAAKPLYERALSIREKALGPEHPDVAQAVDGLASVFQRLGDNPEALRYLQRSLAIREKALGSEHPDVGDSLTRLGNQVMMMGDFAAAALRYERALAIWEKALGPDHPYVAGGLMNLAHQREAVGDYPGAKPLYERAVRIQERSMGPWHPTLGLMLGNLGSVLRRTGEYAESTAVLERAIAIQERALGPKHLELAPQLESLALVHMNTGDLEGARPLLQRALAICEGSLGPDHPDVADLLSDQGNLQERLGDYVEARKLHERALAIRERSLGQDHPKVSYSLWNLADVLWSLGSYSEAAPLFERALASAEKSLGPGHADVGSLLRDFAWLRVDRNDIAGARSLCKRALAIHGKALGPNHPEVAWDHDGLAYVDLQDGDLRGARRHYERALSILETSFGVDHPNAAAAVDNVAYARARMGDYAGAKPLHERALVAMEKGLGPDHPRIAEVLLDMALTKARLGDKERALDAVLRAERIGREHLRLMARTLTEREALRYLSVKPSGMNLALSLAAAGLDPPGRRAVWDALARSRALVLDEMAARHHSIARLAGPEVTRLSDRMMSARARLTHLVVLEPEQDAAGGYQNLLDVARWEADEAERALAEKSLAFRLERQRSHAGLEEMEASLPEGGALLAYARYDVVPTTAEAARLDRGTSGSASAAAYVAFVTLKAGEPFVVPLGAAADLDALVARWRAAASAGALPSGKGSNDVEESYRQVATALRRRIWDPVWPHLMGARRIFVVPDGALNGVSLAALPSEEGRYLVESAPLLHYLSAERDLIDDEKNARRGQGLLVVGGPTYSRRPDPLLRASRASGATAVRGSQNQRPACSDFHSIQFEPLPGAEQEAKEIARLWIRTEDRAGTLTLTGARASEQQLRVLARGRRVLHLATHGFFLGGTCRVAVKPERGIGGLAPARDQPPPAVTGDAPLLLSGLALAGANRRNEAGPGEDDGILTAEEIAGLDLSGLDWAVLSACDTGLGEMKAWEGVLGLSRAFKVAGARTVIMSLWSVEDQSTLEWMKALYASRWVDRLDTAESVRAASLRVLARRRTQGLSDHPFYWAGFVASGAWR